MNGKGLLHLLAIVTAVAGFVYAGVQYTRLATPGSVAWWTDYALWCALPAGMALVFGLVGMRPLADVFFSQSSAPPVKPAPPPPAPPKNDGPPPARGGESGVRRFTLETDDVLMSIILRGDAASDAAGLQKIGEVAKHFSGGGDALPADSRPENPEA